MLNEVTVGGVTVSSNTETEEQMRASLGVDEAAEASEAASKLGKRGGQAAAEARKAKPIKDQPKADADEALEAKDDGDEDEAPAKKANGEDKGDDAKSEKKAAEEAVEKRKRDARTRVLEATREAAELKRENRRLADELAAARTAKPAEAPKEQPRQAQDDDPEPNPDDQKYAEGQFDPAYIKDAGRWAARQEWKTQQAKHAEKARSEGLQRYVETQGAKVDEGIEEAGGQDFLDSLSEGVRAIEPSVIALQQGKMPTPSHALGDEFLRLGEKAPPLMRYLTEHPDVFQRLTSPALKPSEFQREMGRIEERLGGATAGNPPPKPTSKAPAPARPVAGMLAAGEADGPDEKLGLKSYIARENRRQGLSARW